MRGYQLRADQRMNALNGQLPPLSFPAAEQQTLLKLARQAMRDGIQGGGLPEVAPETLAATLHTPSASFVTLLLGGKLRGCVGNLVATQPVYLSVMHNAVGAALRDTRFAPMTLEESARATIHISLLSPPSPLQFDSITELLEQVKPGMDGVVLKQAGRTSTYLPQVWEKLTGKESFLDSLSRKAGLPPDAWRLPGAEILVFRVSEFGDNERA